eukprot:CAMPEP_0114242572 /NCGR_PEP_ID=MMETSP0058-20121206/10252_1 /TAXON_ID=36894 /ORGANISM="Pyramimonas parkeae, CCMP726" /LENGTH=129 /DNA_ID=CAMNT_0001355203 /DNA_START=42 /DNA_END=431 /DNA_ORIENTATION=-
MQVYVYAGIFACLVCAIAVFIGRFSSKPNVTAKHVLSNKPKQPKIFSKQEVSQHNSREDIWVILNNKVYDISSYVEEHPGGDAILNNAGGDNTKEFHGPQHPARVFDMIDDFYIGDLDAPYQADAKKGN